MIRQPLFISEESITKLSPIFLTVILLIVQFSLLPSPAMSGSFTDYIKNKCPSEYKRHESTVAEFALRMKGHVEEYGCGVVNLYYALSASNMDLIDQLEEDTGLMQAAAKVFEISDELNQALRESPDAASTLALFAGYDPEIFKKLAEALSSFSRYDEKQIKKNPNYILYYLLATSTVDTRSHG